MHNSINCVSFDRQRVATTSKIRYIRDDAPAHIGLSCWYGVFDQSNVFVDGVDLDRTSTQKPHVDVYARLFDTQWNQAIGGSALDAIIDRAQAGVETAEMREPSACS
jgi:hypothetical protein